MDIAHVTFSGTPLSINFVILRRAAGSMSAFDTGGFLTRCPATGAGEGARTTPEEKTAVSLAKGVLCFAGSLLYRLPDAACCCRCMISCCYCCCKVEAPNC